MIDGKRVDIENYLSKYNQGMQELARELRELIFDVNPQADEFIKWRNLFYEDNEPVVAIVIHESHVNLQFVRGRELKELGYPMEGTGKNIRHIKISQSSDIDHSLRELIIKAFTLNESS
jgi:hypothetical protein